MRQGEIAYAKVGEHHIAFREYVGDGAVDQEIVMVNGAFFPMESLPEDPIAHRLLEGLAALGRLIVFDRRGIALSDPVTDWDTPLPEQWADDLAAVVDAAECRRPSVFDWASVYAVSRRCSVRYPGLIDRLVLFNPAGSFTEDDSDWVELGIAAQRRIRAGEPPLEQDIAFPGRWTDPAFRAWNDAAGRAGASPSLAERLVDPDVVGPPFDNSQITVPTLVISRSPDNWVVPAAHFHQVAAEIPGAEHIALGHGDALPVGLGVDDLLAEISRYLTGQVILPTPERQLAVIMFTDLVDSTRRAESAGDGGWKQLLDRHDAICGREVTRRGGDVIKTTGDGILALLPSATAAIDAARAIRSDLANDDLQIRVGIHVGEIDRRGDDVSGLSVNTTARIMSAADPGQILTSNLVPETTDAASFICIGPTKLKGLDTTWQLHSAE